MQIVVLKFNEFICSSLFVFIRTGGVQDKDIKYRIRCKGEYCKLDTL